MNDSPDEMKRIQISDVKDMQVQGLTDIGQSFADACDSIGSSFAMTLAKIRMSEAIACAVEHIKNKGETS